MAPQLSNADLSSLPSSFLWRNISILAPNETNPHDCYLSPGKGAGVTIGVGIGIALFAVLATFLIMRRWNKLRDSRGYGSRGHGIPELSSLSKNGVMGEAKELPISSSAVDDYLPQPADDKTLQIKTKTILDQVELFVENFCQGQAYSQARSPNTELSTFDSISLLKPLSTLMLQSNDAGALIKHSLSNYLIRSIATGASAEDTFLPADFSMLPRSLIASGSTANRKVEITQCLSRWRVLTAYLRPDLSSDPTYSAELDRKVSNSVKKFLHAFEPWMKTMYKDQERARGLTVILKEAAGLGTFLFSQPSELQFQWPPTNELGTGRIAVTPALVKLTDESGRKLAQAQVLVSASVKKV